MGGSLGLFVSSDRHLDKIINLCRAAKKKGFSVSLFLTHRGTLVTRAPEFKDLAGTAEISVCKVSLESYGIKDGSVPGITERNYTTQAGHAEIIEDCDRYVVF